MGDNSGAYPVASADPYLPDDTTTDGDDWSPPYLPSPLPSDPANPLSYAGATQLLADMSSPGTLPVNDDYDGSPPPDALTLAASMYPADPTQGAPPPDTTSDITDDPLSLGGKIWTLPNTVLGATYGGLWLIAGKIIGTNPTISFSNNAMRFENNPLADGAVTIGNTISYGGRAGPDVPSPESDGHTYGDHEKRHTYQAETLGPLYLPATMTSLAAGKVLDGNAHGPSSLMETGPQSDPPRPWWW